jgi:hypothetical protein
MIQHVTQDNLFTLPHDHVYYPAGGCVSHLSGLRMDHEVAALLCGHVTAIEYGAANQIRIYGTMQSRTSDHAIYTYPPLLLTPSYYGMYQVTFTHNDFLCHIARNSLRQLFQYVDQPYYRDTTFGVIIPNGYTGYFDTLALPENVCFYEYVYA